MACRLDPYIKVVGPAKRAACLLPEAAAECACVICSVLTMLRSAMVMLAGASIKYLRAPQHSALLGLLQDNFYTSTVYNKGAAIIRIYRTLLGKEGFR